MKPTCPPALGDDVLLAWWAGELAEHEEEELEEHLLGCQECARRGRELLAIAQAVCGLVRKGELPASLLPEVVERLEREGLRVREYRVIPGASVQCSVSPDDDVVLARFAADLDGVTRLDLLIRIDDGPEERLADLPFDAGANELIFAPSADGLRGLPAHVQRARLLAVGPQGERLLGEYAFDHAPWPG